MGEPALLAEKKGELVVFDPAEGRETGRFKLDVDAVAGRTTGGSNQGFEGVSFREEKGRPGGGVFLLVHQRQPARLVAIAFDPLSTPRTLGAADVVGRHGLKKWDDLTAVTWCEPLGRVLVIAERQDRLLVLTPDGQIEGAFPLPGGQQEGLAVLPDDRRGWPTPLGPPPLRRRGRLAARGPRAGRERRDGAGGDALRLCGALATAVIALIPALALPQAPAAGGASAPSNPPAVTAPPRPHRSRPKKKPKPGWTTEPFAIENAGADSASR